MLDWLAAAEGGRFSDVVVPPGIDGRGLKHSHRDKGKWRSITIAVPVESADQLYKVYEAVDSDPRVKYKF